jgi:DNA-binding NarL/FixJ family response regulator
MLTTALLVVWKLLLPLLVVVAVIDSDDRRIRVLRRTGLSQKRIADRLNLSTYRVRKALMA